MTASLGHPTRDHKIESHRPSLGIIATAFNRALLVAGPLLLVPLFIRYLDAEEYGIWITTLSITGYLGLLNLGIAQVVVGVVTREHSRGTLGVASKFLATAFGLYLLLAAAAGAVASIVLIGFCERLSIARTVNCVALWITSSFFLAALPGTLFLGALRGCKRVADEQLFNAAAMMVRFAATATVLVGGFKLVAVATVHGLAGLIPGVLAYFRLRRHEPALDPGLRQYDGALVGDILRPSAWFVVLQVSGVLVWGVDTVVVAWFLGPAAVPAYAVPLQLILALQAMSSIITNAQAPHLAGLVLSERRAEGARLYLDLLSLSMMVAAIGCVGVWIGGRAALEAWAGPAVVPDSRTIIAMGALLAIQCSLLPADSVLVGAMRHRGYAVVSVVEGVINLALSVWWVQWMGAFGVILATLTARMSTNWWFLLARTSRLLPLHIPELARVALRSFVAPAAAGVAVGWMAERSAGAHPIIAAVAGCVVAGAIAATLQRSVIRTLARGK